MLKLSITRRPARDALKLKIDDIDRGLRALAQVLALEAGQRIADQVPTRMDDRFIRNQAKDIAVEAINELLEDLHRQNQSALPR